MTAAFADTSWMDNPERVRAHYEGERLVSGYFSNVIRFPGMDTPSRAEFSVVNFTGADARERPPAYVRQLPAGKVSPEAARAAVARKPVPVSEWNKTIACDLSLNHTRLRVALLFGSYADFASGENVRPKKRTVAISLGLTRETVSRHVNALLKAGYLDVVALQDGGATTYRLTVPARGV